MEAYPKGARAGEPSQAQPETILRELTDCVVTVGMLIAMLVVPALVGGTILWLLNALLQGLSSSHIMPFPN